MKQTWIKQRREELNITQEDLAARLQLRGVNVARATIGHWEQGRTPAPFEDPEFVKALAESLNMGVSTVLKNAGYPVMTRHSEAAEQAAAIIDRLPDDTQQLVLRIIEQFAKT
jgi:transcriptional regulator with XRE-family HTH domain